MAKKTDTKSKKVEGTDYKISANVLLTCYKWGKDKYSAKLKIANAFVIYCRILENEEGGYFLSFPSYKTKEGEWKRSAYCFDKDIASEIKESLADYMDYMG